MCGYDTTRIVTNVVTSVRPDRPGVKLLNLIDIEPGLRIQHWRDGRKAGVTTVTSYPYFGHQSGEASKYRGPNSLWIDTETASGTGSRSLADAGIVPYESGLWNQINYATVVEDPAPVRLEANSAVDFFQAVRRWIDRMDDRGSAYRHEPSVTFVVPCSLLLIIGAHRSVEMVKQGSCRSREVTAIFTHHA